eukprot:CAMPEP_0180258360 /NCGR_PEP_ID=MMETSP0987-20121128/42368_1 /TAXON_ID=697907 /ORGANISM="non described non described, Strain CCMP2293" /LENGTH=706 /DNA_ID=CAMNT_0022227841 /DNA_START=191 /DNA_END=2309 /DNA_ORIENTATION=-
MVKKDTPLALPGESERRSPPPFVQVVPRKKGVRLPILDVAAAVEVERAVEVGAVGSLDTFSRLPSKSSRASRSSSRVSSPQHSARSSSVGVRCSSVGVRSARLIEQTEKTNGFTGTLLRFNSAGDAWRHHACSIRISPLPFADGGQRVVYKAWITLEGPSGEKEAEYPCVAKFFINKQLPHQRYFDEAMAQFMARDFARKFCKFSPQKVEYLRVDVIKLSDGRVCCTEPLLAEEFVKYINNDGNVFEESELAGAFCHFTWASSRQHLLVTDIQGATATWTDPQIHTEDGRGGEPGAGRGEHVLRQAQVRRPLQGTEPPRQQDGQMAPPSPLTLPRRPIPNQQDRVPPAAERWGHAARRQRGGNLEHWGDTARGQHQHSSAAEEGGVLPEDVVDPAPHPDAPRPGAHVPFESSPARQRFDSYDSLSNNDKSHDKSISSDKSPGTGVGAFWSPRGVGVSPESKGFQPHSGGSGGSQSLPGSLHTTAPSSGGTPLAPDLPRLPTDELHPPAAKTTKKLSLWEAGNWAYQKIAHLVTSSAGFNSPRQSGAFKDCPRQRFDSRDSHTSEFFTEPARPRIDSRDSQASAFKEGLPVAARQRMDSRGSQGTDDDFSAHGFFRHSPAGGVGKDASKMLEGGAAGRRFWALASPKRVLASPGVSPTATARPSTEGSSGSAGAPESPLAFPLRRQVRSGKENQPEFSGRRPVSLPA